MAEGQANTLATCIVVEEKEAEEVKARTQREAGASLQVRSPLDLVMDRVAGRLTFFESKWQEITSDHKIPDRVLHSHIEFVDGFVPHQVMPARPICMSVKEQSD